MNVSDASLPSACCCGAPQIMRFGDCILCIRDNCLGGWLWRQAHKHAAGRFRIRKIRNMGEDSWLDFVQYWRGYAWRKAAEGAGSVGHLDVVTATKTWLNNRHVDEIPTADEHIEDQIEREEVPVDGATLEEVVDREIRAVTGTSWPLYHTYLKKLVAITGDTMADKLAILTFAGQIEIQDAALLLGRPIKETIDRFDEIRKRVRQAV